MERRTSEDITSITAMAQLLADRLPKDEVIQLFILLDEHSDHDADMIPIHAAMEAQVRRLAPELFSMEVEEDPTIDEDPILEEEDALTETLISAAGTSEVRPNDDDFEDDDDLT